MFKRAFSYSKLIVKTFLRSEITPFQRRISDFQRFPATMISFHPNLIKFGEIIYFSILNSFQNKIIFLFILVDYFAQKSIPKNKLIILYPDVFIAVIDETATIPLHTNFFYAHCRFIHVETYLKMQRDADCRSR